MIPELGQLALALALIAALALGVMPLVGAARNDAMLMRQAGPAAVAQFLFVALAFGCLAASFVLNDFSVINVANNSNSKLPLHYRFAATWGSHEGSILLWTLVMSAWTVAVALKSRHLPRVLAARVLAHHGAGQRRAAAVRAVHVEPVPAPPARGGRRTRSESAAAGSGHGVSSPDPLCRLRRISRSHLRSRWRR